MTQLSPNFSFAELTASATAASNGLNNVPDAQALQHLTQAAQAMEAVRTLLNAPIRVTSGYRSPEVNRAVGGSKTSAHCLGYAIDFTCAGFGTPFNICNAIVASNIVFDQLIHEYGAWAHISFDPRARRMPLTIASAARGYIAGILPIRSRG
jgi:putative chitinase